MIGPRLRWVLRLLLGLFALLVANSVYLGGISLLEWSTGESRQGPMFQAMFLAHLALGVLTVAPFIVYAGIHGRAAWHRPNRRAVMMGLVLAAASVALLLTGLALTRELPGLALADGGLRRGVYWVHVAALFLVIWAFVLHRLAGPPIRWRQGGMIVGGAVAATALAGLWQFAASVQPTDLPEQDRYHLMPSLAKTANGQPIAVDALVDDDYCADCHQDVHDSWSVSAHRFASFNNPAYRFAVAGTRETLSARYGDARGTRFCAGCHDPAPLFSGELDRVDFDPDSRAGQAGITCTACHAITRVDSPRGNADYTIAAPRHYPFARAEGGLGKWLNHLLIRANPQFHRRTFLKPVHREPEFCGTCHKVHLPQQVNDYKWLRGQNHYDSWLLSGVSGHGAASFYYPPEPKTCSDCHMALQPSQDFGARVRDEGAGATVHDHQFPAANTALGHWLAWPETAQAAHRQMLEGALRVDLFAMRGGGDITGPLTAPLGESVPVLQAGGSYLFDVVLRTLKLGHHFTQGTADSNQVWLEVVATLDGVPLAHSGAMDPRTGRVDPNAHFVNAWVLDRDGRRIDRRNAEDIFTVLYNHQIPPGAADVVHYRLALPSDAAGIITVRARLHYRKFDTQFIRLMADDPQVPNELPVTLIAEDVKTFRVTGDESFGEAGGGSAAPQLAGADGSVPLWQRWNDYGIGLLRKPGVGELRQAEYAFEQVERLGRGDGPLNLARVYLREGRVDEAAAALERAGTMALGAPPWVVAWFSGLVNRQNGYLDEAISSFTAVAQTRFDDARARGFDFSRDYRVLNELAVTYYQRARASRGEAGRARREADLLQARRWFEQVLPIDPENLAAHYGLAQVHAALGNATEADYHRAQHARFKPDDNAADRAVAAARRADPVASRAADDTVIYLLEARTR